MLNQVSVRVMAEPVLKFNTAVLRCQVPQNAALYTKIQSWQRGNTIIYPTSKGGKRISKYSFPLLHNRNIKSKMCLCLCLSLYFICMSDVKRSVLLTEIPEQMYKQQDLHQVQ